MAEPSSGVLQCEDEKVVRLFFVPWEVKEYDITLPIYLDGNLEKPY